MFPEITRDDVFRLETRRLWLRWPDLADAAALAGIAGQADVAEMTVNVPHPYPKAAASRQVEAWRDANAAGLGLALVLTRQGSDRTPVGLVEVEPVAAATPPPVALQPAPPGSLALKVGVLMDPAHAGAGLATEALQAVLDAAFLLTPAGRVEASVRVVNPGGRRVLERCGFAYEATVLREAPARGGMVSCDGFRLDRRTWASLKAWRLPLAPAGVLTGRSAKGTTGSAEPCSAG